MQYLAPNDAVMWGLFAIWQYCINPRRILERYRARAAVKCPNCALCIWPACRPEHSHNYTDTDIPAGVARIQRKKHWLLIETPTDQHLAVYVHKERRIHIREHGQPPFGRDTRQEVVFDMPRGRYEVILRTDPHHRQFYTLG